MKDRILQTLSDLRTYAVRKGYEITLYYHEEDSTLMRFANSAISLNTNEHLIRLDITAYAGRQRASYEMITDLNKMDEMKKIMRVAKPDMKLFIGESITGNDCIEQAQKFNDAVDIDGIILSKADVDEKGGAAISVSYVTKKPILYIGTGQEYPDLERFDKDKIIASMGL